MHTSERLTEYAIQYRKIADLNSLIHWVLMRNWALFQRQLKFVIEHGYFGGPGDDTIYSGYYGDNQIAIGLGNYNKSVAIDASS